MADAVDESVPPNVLNNLLNWIKRNLEALPDHGHQAFRELASTDADTLERLKRASREVVARTRAMARNALIRLVDFVQNNIGVVPAAVMACMADIDVRLYFPQAQLPIEPNAKGQRPPPQPPQGSPPQPPQGSPPQPLQRPQEAYLTPLLRFTSCLLQFIWEKKWWVLAGAVAGGMGARVAVGTTGGLSAAAAVGVTGGSPVAVAAGAMGSPTAVAAGATMGVPSAMAVHEALRPHGAVAPNAAAGPHSAVAVSAAVGLPVVAIAVGAAVALPVVAGVAAGAAVGGAAGLTMKAAKDYFLGKPHEHQD